MANVSSQTSPLSQFIWVVSVLFVAVVSLAFGADLWAASTSWLLGGPAHSNEIECRHGAECFAFFWFGASSLLLIPLSVVAPAVALSHRVRSSPRLGVKVVMLAKMAVYISAGCFTGAHLAAVFH